MSSVGSEGQLDVEGTVLDIVRDTLSYKATKLDASSALLGSGSGLFDSFSLLELVLKLEERFGIQIPDEDLDPDVFANVETVSAYVASKLRKA